MLTVFVQYCIDLYLSYPLKHYNLEFILFAVHRGNINSFYADFICLPAVSSRTRAKSGPTTARVVRRRFDKARLTVDRDGAA